MPTAKTKKERNKGDEAKPDMTPMIDVVFQLIIFFIVTLKQDDILSSLEALRPAPDPSATSASAVEPLTILIGEQQNGFFFNGSFMSRSRLTETFRNIAKRDKNSMVIIKCDGKSRHGSLVHCLDMLASVGLTKISVFSM